MKKFILSTLLVAGCLTASAQEKQTEYVFQPHWYLQGQVGAQYTLGEIGFGDLISPNVQIGVGYKFNPYIGLRLAVDAWQSKAGFDGNEFASDGEYKWDWKYVAPSLDVTFDLSNLFFGFNPERKWSYGLLAGIGANIAWGNDDINDRLSGTNTKPTVYACDVWDGTNVLLQGKVGAFVDYNISDAWSVGLEVNGNFLNDHYNSKHAPNADWYFNALLGVKYNFGPTYTKKTKEVPVLTQPVEKVVEKIVEKKVEVEKVQPIRRDIFFVIRGSEISLSEMQKVREVAEYMKKYPESKVVVTGFADKGTGNATINAKYAEARAKKVADTLQSKYGIDASRITYTSKGDSEQPYAEQELNRVSICVAE